MTVTAVARTKTFSSTLLVMPSGVNLVRLSGVVFGCWLRSCSLWQLEATLIITDTLVVPRVGPLPYPCSTLGGFVFSVFYKGRCWLCVGRFQAPDSCQVWCRVWEKARLCVFTDPFDKRG